MSITREKIKNYVNNFTSIHSIISPKSEEFSNRSKSTQTRDDNPSEFTNKQTIYNINRNKNTNNYDINDSPFIFIQSKNYKHEKGVNNKYNEFENGRPPSYSKFLSGSLIKAVNKERNDFLNSTKIEKPQATKLINTVKIQIPLNNENKNIDLKSSNAFVGYRPLTK